MNLEQLIDTLRRDREFSERVTAWVELPHREAQYGSVPPFNLHLAAALKAMGIRRLYSHQTEAIEALQRGNNVVVATPTASGKSLCYILPVLDSILNEPQSRALFLYPTKALAQDQRNEIAEWIDAVGGDIASFTYDGDTPATSRRSIRRAGQIVITNPDMLHTGILPHHTKWVHLFENLKYVVIDELHTYRGVFGSHVANVLRRLQRIARFYGSSPKFVTSSATIANPGDLAERLIGLPFTLIDRSGAPRAPKHVVLYNPPVVNEELGIRRSSILQARDILKELLGNGIQTIAFTRSRVQSEVLLSYLREALPRVNVRGYRGGYLPGQRREIERGLREGGIRGVIATNALELGIDIGSLEAAVLVGYPGTIASALQQMGRAGRKDSPSLAILVASSSPLDQHLVTHPDYFFGRSPERGLVQPDNLLIRVSHLKCAAFELPFTAGEVADDQDLREILDYLSERRILHASEDRWHWMTEGFPAEDISLRSASTGNVVIIDTTEPQPRVIGEVDEFSAPMLLHDEAIYIHDATQYQVESLDLEERKAFVRRVDVNYYTDATYAADTAVLDVLRKEGRGLSSRYYGEVRLTAQPTTFKKIRFGTHENLGWGKIFLPPRNMHTTAYWMTLEEDLVSGFTPGELEAGLMGLRNLLAEVAPLFLSCDRRDLYSVAQIRSPFTERPTIFLCDAYPGGVGLAEMLFALEGELRKTCLQVLKDCICRDGCPSCVGAPAEVGTRAREIAHRILDRLEVGSGVQPEKETRATGGTD
ncbi:MAG: DEAD/DEAH box helicase [Clostridia bacterium]